MILSRIKGVDRRLLTILSIVFVQIAGAAMILPILPLFAEEQFQMSASTVTLLVSAYFLAQFFAGPYLGQLSDEYGRVPILVISQFGSAISFFMMALAGAPWLLFAARIIDGITGGNIIVAQAYITDITPAEKRTEALGYTFAVFGLGFIVGPALGGVLSAWLGARMPFVIAAVITLITTIMCWIFLPETAAQGNPSLKHHKLRIRLSPMEVVQNYPLLLVLFSAFIGQFGLGLLQATFALYGQDVLFVGQSASAVQLGVGLMLGVVGLGQFVSQALLIRPLKKRFGDARLVIVGTVLRSIGMGLLAALATPILGSFGGLVFSLGTGLMMPPLQSLATLTVEERVRGGVLGVYQSSVSLAIIISTAIAGIIYQVAPNLPFWFASGLSLLVLGPASLLLRLAQQNRLLHESQRQVGSG